MCISCRDMCMVRSLSFVLNIPLFPQLPKAQATLLEGGSTTNAGQDSWLALSLSKCKMMLALIRLPPL